MAGRWFTSLGAWLRELVSGRSKPKSGRIILGGTEKRYKVQFLDRRNDLPVHTSKKYRNRSGRWSLVTIHHSLTREGSAKAFARYHVEHNGWPGIGYHYVVNKDGTVEWCWNHDVKSYHVGTHNNICVGVCLVGNFLVQPLHNLQKYATFWVLKEKLGAQVTQLIGHSELAGYNWKDCPVIDMDDFREDYGEFLTRR